MVNAESGIERQPPEWAPHDSVWIGFPSHANLWEDDLAPAQAEVAAFANAVHADGAGERVQLVAADDEAAETARTLAAPGIDMIVAPFGDIWLRDTGPIIVSDGRTRAARAFVFNGWGEKYRLEGDDDLALRLSETGGFGEARRCKYVLEGGAIDVDGTGLVVTTEQCLLNPNRNPDLSKAEIEARLRGDLGLDRILWLGDGLLGDHTDGHVDNLARFVGKNRIAIPEPAGNDDPNAAIYRDAQARARGFALEVVPVPSPGRVLRDGEIIPASYMNFYIGNAAVVVPLYGAPNDHAAVAAIQALFPTRRVVGFRANHILTGGGSFHCISQQVPSL
ncbi:agmatine deiminase family protein [Sphingomonas tabacisoli]|uniref:Agmatine deiminase family protein n=1 Tax=Sphingomonas tabacisoli TaxID=2249466 RepID=A0ABW4I1J2_9SPHN